MATENILRQPPPARSGLPIAIGAAVLALVLAAPSRCQTNRESTLPDPAPNSAPYINSAILASAKLLASPVFALPEPPSSREQASPPDAAAQGQSKTTGEDHDKAPKAQPASQSGTSNDRLFDVLPNFLTLESAGEVPPLTTGQKFRVVARGSFDITEFFWYGILAGLSQAENSEPGYRQGAAGYGKRYGAYVADGTIENFMTQAVFASVLRQDPATYQVGQGRIPASRRLCGEQNLHHPYRFGRRAVQFLRDLRKRGRVGNLHVRLPSSRRSHSAEYRQRVGHPGRIRYDHDRGERVLAGHSPKVLSQDAARRN